MVLWVFCSFLKAFFSNARWFNGKIAPHFVKKLIKIVIFRPSASTLSISWQHYTIIKHTKSLLLEIQFIITRGPQHQTQCMQLYSTIMHRKLLLLEIRFITLKCKTAQTSTQHVNIWKEKYQKPVPRENMGLKKIKRFGRCFKRIL